MRKKLATLKTIRSVQSPTKCWNCCHSKR